MRGSGGGPGGQRARGPRGAGAPSSLTSSILVFLSCLGTVYVGGRLWQDSRLQKELVEARKMLQSKPLTKAVSVDESIMKIEFGELQKREALLQVELAEAKAKGFVSMSAASLNSTSGSPSSATWLSNYYGNISSSNLVPARYLAVVGINTRFAERPLREAIRNSWFPSNSRALRRIENEHGIIFRFIVGRSPNRGDSSDKAIAQENQLYQDFLILEDHEEDDHDMARKLKAFYAAAVRQWDSAFYVKMDDNVYLNIPGLIAILKEYKSRPRMYLGCMKSGDVVSDPNSRWYEPEHLKFGDGKQYMRHAAGPFHIVTKELALYLAINKALLKEYRHEDVSLGAWMLGLDVTYEDNRLLCCASAPEDECAKRRESGKPCAAVYDWHCSGLCEAEKRMQEVHRHCAGKSTGVIG